MALGSSVFAELMVLCAYSERSNAETGVIKKQKQIKNSDKTHKLKKNFSLVVVSKRLSQSCHLHGKHTVVHQQFCGKQGEHPEQSPVWTLYPHGSVSSLPDGLTINPKEIIPLPNPAWTLPKI